MWIRCVQCLSDKNDRSADHDRSTSTAADQNSSGTDDHDAGAASYDRGAPNHVSGANEN